MTLLVEPRTELETRAFLEGRKSPEAFEAWIVSHLDEVSSVEEHDALWDLRLLLTEYGENLRPIEDARQRAFELLRDLTISAPWADSNSTTESIGSSIIVESIEG